MKSPPHEMTAVPINNPSEAYRELEEETDAAVRAVLASGSYALGPAAKAFEEEFATFTGATHAIGVSSGTEAVLLALQELEIGPGDEVIVPAFTFIASATAVARLGARTRFVDIDPETFQMDVEGLAAAVTPQTRAVIPVHLYGYAAPLDAYREALAGADKEIPLVEDAAQAIGTWGLWNATRTHAGNYGDFGCFSFYPTKNLPACGEAGIVITGDATRAERLRQLRNHGQVGTYEHGLLGGNARLDALQAAILSVRLPHVERWNETRRRHAARYDTIFRNSGVVDAGLLRLPPPAPPSTTCNYHQYTVRTPHQEALRAGLAERRISAGVYYPIALPHQPIFASLDYSEGEFPEAETACKEVLSLPIHQFLNDDAIEHVGASVVEILRAQG